MVRLKRVTPTMPGWTRRKHGTGFTFLDVDGSRLCSDEVDRCKALVIPPAWKEVWICPFPTGHVQAVGTNDAGRRQYIYHPEWRLRRDAEKFEHIRTFATSLPAARRTSRGILSGGAPDLEIASATAFTLLDLGVFRIGSDRYLEENGSYGLTTLDKAHARLADDLITISYVAKSAQERELRIQDAAVVATLTQMRKRRGGSTRLLAYKAGRRWHDLTPEDVNDYIKTVTSEDCSAKDFRTWHGTVVAAAALARQSATTKTARKRAVSAAMKEVAEHLGNTATIARKSYVDPRIVDLYEDGVTVGADHLVAAAGSPMSEELEREVLDLLTDS